MNNKVNILIVDDRPEGVLAVQAVLSNPAYNLVTASSGSDALKALLKDDFAVILMDVQMPIMNGFETAAVIKTREKSKDIPIIFMSAINQDEQYVYQGYSVGAIDYLMKPFDPYILKSKVSIFVELYRKNILIREQAQKLYESEVKTYAQALDKLELKSLRRYQYLADAIPQIVFRLMPDGIYEYFNKVWFEYTGLSATTSMGMEWKSAIHSEDLEKLDHVFSSLHTEDGIELEIRIKSANDHYRWHLVRMEPERYEHPTEVKSWLGTATDIEDRKRDEDRSKFLAEAGELLVSSLDYEKTLHDIAKLAVVQLADWCAFDILGEDGKIVSVAIVHRDPSKLELTKKLHASYLAKEDNLVGAANVIRTGNREVHSFINDGLLRNFTNDEDQINLVHSVGDQSAMIIPMKVQNTVVGAMTFSSVIPNHYLDERNVSIAEELGRRAGLAYENSKLYRISQQAIEVRNDFLSIASHELNTPITSLKLQLQLTKKQLDMNVDGIFPVDKFTRSIDASVKQVDRLINLVQVLLDVSRIQSGKFNFSFENLQVSDVVTEVLDRFKEIISNADCELSVSNLTDVSAYWDKTRVEQVIINILTNAIKYAPGKIELRLEKLDGHIKFLFVDHGKGIDNDKIRSIFDRFERATSNETVSGLGLGLYIVKQIVEGHGGKIEVSSKIDAGTTFTVLLPLDSRPMLKTPDSDQSHVH